jgi:putative ABC transport system substrate-binding protein
VHRVAFINSGSLEANAANVAAFRQELAELGYVEGRNLVVDYRFAEQAYASLPALVNKALAAKPDVIVSTGGPPTIRAVKDATSAVPVVFITGDPVIEKIVSNLAHPGANLTGFAVLAPDLEAKRLEMLKQIVPSATRIAVLWNPAAPSIDAIMERVDAAAAKLGVTLMRFGARDPGELVIALGKIGDAKPDALFVVGDPMLGFERVRIVEFARRARLPAIYFWGDFVEIGGLASYATSLTDMYRHAASYVDRILKGKKPGDLPIEQPTKFELVLNRDTARELGIAFPAPLQQRADRVLP